MPAKTKYRNRKNKTRRHNNKTKKCRKRQSKCRLAKLMRGGNGENDDIEIQTMGNLNNGTSEENNILQEQQKEVTEEGETQGQGEGEVKQPTTENKKITIKRYNSTAQDIDIKQGDTYENILGDAPDPFIVFIDEREKDVTLTEVVDLSVNKIDIFTYKYKNLVDNDNEIKNIQDIPKIEITNEDLKKVELSQQQLSVIGNRVLETEYYIDNQGIMRKYNVNENTIQKVLIIDVPDKINVESQESNTLLTEANKALDDLGSLLEEIKKSMPDYIEIDIADKRYIISKETPYIIVPLPQV
jgi:hypothetical protein